MSDIFLAKTQPLFQNRNEQEKLFGKTKEDLSGISSNYKRKYRPNEFEDEVNAEFKFSKVK